MIDQPGSSPDRPAPASSWRPALVLALLAFVCCAVAGRLHVVREADSPRYDRLAANLQQHGVYSSCLAPPLLPEFERMPGYPAFMAAVKTVAPHGDYPIMVAQALLHALSVLAIFFLAQAITRDRLVTIAAAAGWALYPYAIYYGISVMSEALATFATIVATAGFVLYLRHRRWSWILLSLAGGVLAAYTRPNLIAIPFFWGLVVLLSPRLRRSGALPALVVVCAGLTVAMVPWLIRNQTAFHRFLPGSHNYMGANVCVSSIQFALSDEAVADYCYGRDVDGLLDVCDAETSLRYDAILRAKGLEQIRQHPWRTAGLATLRPLRLWVSFRMQHAHNPRLELVMRWGTIVLFPLFVVGMVQLARRTEHGWVVASVCLFLSLSHLALFVSSRYSQPAKGFYVLGVAYLLVTVWRNRQALRAGRWRGLRWPGQRGAAPAR